MKEFSYPKWHGECRRLKSAGYKSEELADKYGVSISRISQIVSPNWRTYIVLYSAGGTALRQTETISNVAHKIKTGEYTFTPVDLPSPKEREDSKPKRKAPPVQEVEMARVREFEESKEFIEGKKIVGAMIRCSRCDNTEVYKNYAGTVSGEHMEKEFTRRGWVVGKNKRTDICPDCMEKFRSAKRNQTNKEGKEMFVSYNTTETPHPKPTEADLAKKQGIQPPQGIQPASEIVIAEKAKPAQMSKADDKVITLKLMDVYEDEVVGYQGEWDDDKVAADLGVPVEWVATIRDRSFGPMISKSSVKQLEANVLALQQKGEQLVLLIDKKIDALKALDDKVQSQIEIMEKAIERFDELKNSLITEDNRIEPLLSQFKATAEEFKALRVQLQQA